MIDRSIRKTVTSKIKDIHVLMIEKRKKRVYDTKSNQEKKRKQIVEANYKKT